MNDTIDNLRAALAAVTAELDARPTQVDVDVLLETVLQSDRRAEAAEQQRDTARAALLRIAQDPLEEAYEARTIAAAALSALEVK